MTYRHNQGRNRTRLSLANEIAESLREDILSGALQPGERVGVVEIATAFGTSQAPVREALALLRAKGLFVTLHRRGTFVSTVSEADARAAYEVRSRLDAYVTTETLNRVTEDNLNDLTILVEKMRDAAALGDLEDMTRHDMAFHGYLYSLCDSDILERIWDLVSQSVRQFIVVAGGQYFAATEFADIADMHGRLLDLIRDGQVEQFQTELQRQLDLMWLRIDSPSDAMADTQRTPSPPQ